MCRVAARSVARAFVYPTVEVVNSVVLTLRSRRVAHSRPGPLQVGGGKCVLVLAAHPDDETIGCFGAITAHSAHGDRVAVVMVTDGSGSRAGGLGPKAMAEQRSGEVAELRKILPGVEIDQWAFPEGEWQEDQLAERLGSAILGLAPDVLYTPSCVDFHPEHLRVARAVARVLRNQGSRIEVRAYQMQVPLGPELVNRYVLLDQHAARLKDLAIRTYRSQRGALELWKREARYIGSWSGARTWAEAYWQMDPRQFTGIMEYGTWDWPDTPFRSLDGRPFRDIEAYVRGSDVRRKLAAIATVADLS